ncbi:hypothetical protein ACFX13_039322 [Malus domestica]
MLEQAITLSFKTSNNKAEYEALLASLRMAKDLADKKLVIHSDSQLITSQATEEYTTKHPKITQYLEKVRKQLEAFQTYTLTQVPRADNAHADVLASLGLRSRPPIQTLYSGGISRQAKHRDGAGKILL